MMEFEEIQKIWNEQKGETMYVINENALHRSVTNKKNVASKKINRAEILISIVNTITSAILFKVAITGHPIMFITFGLFAATVVYIQFFRRKRKKAENNFDRSMLGELDHAISNTNYILRFNYFVLVYIISFAIITIPEMIIRMDSWQEWLIVILATLLSLFLVHREQKACNIPRKKQLLKLRKKLTEV